MCINTGGKKKIVQNAKWLRAIVGIETPPPLRRNTSPHQLAGPMCPVTAPRMYGQPTNANPDTDTCSQHLVCFSQQTLRIKGRLSANFNSINFHSLGPWNQFSKIRFVQLCHASRSHMIIRRWLAPW